MTVGGVRVGCVLVRVIVSGGGLIGDDYVDFGCAQAASGHLVCFETCADVEGSGGFLKKTERNAGIDEGAEEHVAANA